MFFFNQSIVNLHYCVSFRYTHTDSVIHICVDLYCFFNSFSLIVYYKILSIIPRAIQ